MPHIVAEKVLSLPRMFAKGVNVTRFFLSIIKTVEIAVPRTVYILTVTPRARAIQVAFIVFHV